MTMVASSITSEQVTKMWHSTHSKRQNETTEDRLHAYTMDIQDWEPVYRGRHRETVVP